MNEAVDNVVGKNFELLGDPGTPDSVWLKAATFIARKRRSAVWDPPVKTKPERVATVRRR